jgi:antirestriction protein ArdC
MKTDLHQLVTDQIIAKLQSGTIPWMHYADAPLLFPRNLATGNPYRGVNIFLLSGTRYGSPWWVTYNQALDLGGHVIKGEKSHHFIVRVVNWIVEEEDGTRKTIQILKQYSLFNVEQCEGLEKRLPTTEQTPKDSYPVEDAEAIVSAMPDPPKIILDRVPRAYYVPSQDTVHMTERSVCVSNAAFYAGLFHELAHSTGHEKRLNRVEGGEWFSRGTRGYAKEELLAEMAAAMLCAEVGLFQEVVDNAAAYIEHWLIQLGQDNQLVVHAASRGQKAADWILNRQYAEPVVSIEAHHVMTAGA